MKKEMLINVIQPEECRIAIVEDGVLEELYVERSSQELIVGNIYKGRVVNIESSIQAAFRMRPRFDACGKFGRQTRSMATPFHDSERG